MGRCPTGTVPGGLQRGGRKKGLQTELQNGIVQEIETLLGRQSIADLDFEAIEMAARRQTLRLAARALEQRLNTDTSDHVGPQLPCGCGGSAQYHGRHEKTFESVLGPLHLQRAYYHCALCESGFCPRDRTLGLESFSLTPTIDSEMRYPKFHQQGFCTSTGVVEAGCNAECIVTRSCAAEQPPILILCWMIC